MDEDVVIGLMHMDWEHFFHDLLEFSLRDKDIDGQQLHHTCLIEKSLPEYQMPKLQVFIVRVVLVWINYLEICVSCLDLLFGDMC